MYTFSSLSSILQAFIATLFTYSLTALGASLVFFFKNINKRIMDCFMGVASGVMIAAAFWSLLQPALELCDQINISKIYCCIGFFIGGVFIIGSDLLMNRFSKIENTKKKEFLLFKSVTLHNIPEGLAVGVAFGSLAISGSGVSLLGAISIAVAIAIQNFPEGACVSLPLRSEGCSRKKAFFYGQLSGVVEPVAGVLGAVFVLVSKNIMPHLLSFSAGAMIAVVCSELIPDAFKENKNIANLSVLIGFLIMMILEIVL